ncbi:hypothetical protein Tco_0022500, partial [Tanacetum coccineum]
TKAKAKGESVRKRPREDLGDSSEAFAENLNYSADSSIAARGTKAEVGVQDAKVFKGGPVLETECPPFKVLGESSEIFV